MGECVWEEEQSGKPGEERGGRAEDRNSSRLTNWEEGTPHPHPLPGLGLLTLFLYWSLRRA